MFRPEFDFSQCKLCGQATAAPRFHLHSTTVYVCSVCDFHAINYLDQVPRGEGDAPPGVDSKARAYIEERLGEADRWLPARLQLLRRHCQLPAPRVLDVGAGVGQFLSLLASQGASIFGIEPSRVRREFARLHFGLDLSGTLIEHPQWQQHHAGFFDLITLWDVIEHVNFPVATLEAAYGLLKPGGLLFIDTPSRDAASYRLSEALYRLTRGEVPLYLEQVYSPTLFGHKQIFRPRHLVRLVTQAGLEVVELRHRYPSQSFFSPGQRVVLVARKAAGPPPS
ncbi:MAG: class I SAM-dependent methyltransferase [Desulfuromonadales bacterium]|nr:class I SAM-dependent methyltransferase [Desulfuromonadales bacterium]